MSAISELISLLDKIPAWRRLSSLPERFDELESRLKILENKLVGDGDICPRCKNPNFKLIKSEPDKIFGGLGSQRRTYVCSFCEFTEEKLIE
jgi:hypothetical protein